MGKIGKVRIIEFVQSMWVCQGSAQQYPERIDGQPTVQVGGVLLLVDVHSFQHSSIPLLLSWWPSVS